MTTRSHILAPTEVQRRRLSSDDHKSLNLPLFQTQTGFILFLKCRCKQTWPEVVSHKRCRVKKHQHSEWEEKRQMAHFLQERVSG